jgi:hypothetical protein
MKRPTTFILAIGFVFLAACAQKEPQHLPRQQMEALLLDVFLAENASVLQQGTNHNYLGSKNTDTLAHYYREIFAKHQITEETFNTSLDWYKHNQIELDTVLAHVMTRADKMLEKRQSVK